MCPTVQQLLALTLFSGALLFDTFALLHCPPPKRLIAGTSRGHRLLLTTSAGDETNEKNAETINREESLTSATKKLPSIGEPQIFSKQALFGNGYNAVTVSAVDEEFSAAAIGQKNLPKGIERLQPSELVKKKPMNNDGENETEADEYEIVDKFRFKIDADTLQNAILQKQSLKARQELLSTVGSAFVPLSKQEVSFDASFLEKLASFGTLDESGDSTILRVQLDYDEFESMVHATQLAEQEPEGEGNESTHTDGDNDDDVAALFSSNPVFVDRQMRRDRKNSLQYSSSRMDEAERFLAQSSSSFTTMTDGGWKDHADSSHRPYPSSDQRNKEKSAILTPTKSLVQDSNYNSSFLLESVLQPFTNPRKAGILTILGLAGDLPTYLPLCSLFVVSLCPLTVY